MEGDCPVHGSGAGAMPGGRWRRPEKLSDSFFAGGASGRLCILHHDHGDHMHQETLVKLAERKSTDEDGPSAAFGGEGSFFRYSKRTAFRPVPGSGDYSGRRNPVNPAATAHETYQFDQEGHSLTLGYEIRLGDRRVFHSGDTIASPS